jgi:hypothetical protein
MAHVAFCNASSLAIIVVHAREGRGDSRPTQKCAAAKLDIR